MYSVYLSLGIAAASWCRGSSVVVKRTIVFSKARKFSMKLFDAGNPAQRQRGFIILRWDRTY